MIINDKVYDLDMTQIGFVLALMNDGDVASWKEQFIEEAITTSDVQNIPLNMGTYVALKHDLQEAFSHMMPPEML